jgi:hypothetical protein
LGDAVSYGEAIALQRHDRAGEMGVGFLEVVQQPRALTVEFCHEVIVNAIVCSSHACVL